MPTCQLSIRWWLVNETGNRNRILERCKFRFWLVHWIDPRSIEQNYACCLSNALDRPSNLFFFRLSVCLLLTDRLSNDYVHNSSPIFTKFCMRFRNVVSSSPIVCERNRKYFADFRGVRIPILTVFNRWWPHFSTDQHQIAHTDKIQQCRLCVQWRMKPEIEIGF